MSALVGVVFASVTASAQCPGWDPVLAQQGVDVSITSLATFDDGTGAALYALGWFTTAGGVPATNAARWNGTNWSPVGAGVSTLLC